MKLYFFIPNFCLVSWWLWTLSSKLLVQVPNWHGFTHEWPWSLSPCTASCLLRLSRWAKPSDTHKSGLVLWPSFPFVSEWVLESEKRKNLDVAVHWAVKIPFRYYLCHLATWADTGNRAKYLIILVETSFHACCFRNQGVWRVHAPWEYGKLGKRFSKLRQIKDTRFTDTQVSNLSGQFIGYINKLWI